MKVRRILEKAGGVPVRDVIHQRHRLHPMYRDLENVPYRETLTYRRAKKIAQEQRARLRHKVSQLWPSENGQSTSGMVRTPRFGGAA